MLITRNKNKATYTNTSGVFNLLMCCLSTTKGNSTTNPIKIMLGNADDIF